MQPKWFPKRRAWGEETGGGGGWGSWVSIQYGRRIPSFPCGVSINYSTVCSHQQLSCITKEWENTHPSALSWVLDMFHVNFHEVKIKIKLINIITAKFINLQIIITDHKSLYFETNKNIGRNNMSNFRATKRYFMHMQFCMHFRSNIACLSCKKYEIMKHIVLWYYCLFYLPYIIFSNVEYRSLENTWWQADPQNPRT